MIFRLNKNQAFHSLTEEEILTNGEKTYHLVDARVLDRYTGKFLFLFQDNLGLQPLLIECQPHLAGQLFQFLLDGLSHSPQAKLLESLKRIEELLEIQNREKQNQEDSEDKNNQ